jgi:alpha-methylacyl-CoA racemase
MAGPLQGVRVVELPAIGPVPFVGMLLADFGAEVVRIERLAPDALSIPALGRGRRSVALDLRRPGATEVVLRLAERSDALIEGFRPGVAERLGVGPDAVLARNRTLVYGRMTGWGQDGPLSATAGHDITYLAVSGLLHGIGPADGPPTPPVNYLADLGGGAMSLAVGLLAALLHARATGEGQVIDAAMTDGAAYLGTMTRALFASGAWSDTRGANILDGAAPNYRCYACSDGRYVAVGALEPEFWHLLLDRLGLDAATTASPYDSREWSALTKLLADVFATRSRDEWAGVFAGSDACVAPVLTLAEAPDHPHNAARASYTGVTGETVPAPAPRFSATPAVVGEPSPNGAYTTTLLAELGYDESAVAALRAAGAIS